MTTPTTPAEIRWVPADTGGLTGYVGSLEAFRIAPAADDEKWPLHLTSALPAQDGNFGAAATVEGLCALADQWLEAYLSARPYVAAALAELREIVKMERDAQDGLAAEHAEYGRDARSERCYAEVRTLDWVLATMDRMEAGK